MTKYSKIMHSISECKTLKVYKVQYLHSRTVKDCIAISFGVPLDAKGKGCDSKENNELSTWHGFGIRCQVRFFDFVV